MIVEATNINAPNSTKNKAEERDPGDAVNQGKGTQWLLGMKAHIGVASRSKLNHTLVTGPGNWRPPARRPQALG